MKTIELKRGTVRFWGLEHVLPKIASIVFVMNEEEEAG